jgi:outer membrane receptor protein involved in Fe transport
VSNVTIATNRQQRQNLGRTRITGIQTDVEYRLRETWRVTGGYLYNDATVREFTANPDLLGKYLPQVPKHRGSLQVSYSNPKIAAISLAMQAVSLQYNDDLNANFIPTATLVEAGYSSFTGGASQPGLPGYASFDLTAIRDVGRYLQVFFGAQNLFNQVSFVQTNPSTTGTPRLVNVGVRVRFAGR